MKPIPLTFLLLLLGPASANAFGQISDDFEDGILDPALWVNNYGTVVEQNGAAESIERGHLTSAQELGDPDQHPLTIHGTFTDVSSGGVTFITVAWRSEYGQTGPVGSAESDAYLNYHEFNNSNGELLLGDYASQTSSNYVDIAPFSLGLGESAEFTIVDDGGWVTVDVVNLQSGQTASMSGQLITSNSFGNYFKFYGRETSGTIAALEDISIFSSDLDNDEDGLLDADEIATYGTDPLLFDTDGDGLGDGQELGMTNATVTADTDLSVFKEDRDPSTTTDPLNADTDGGGIDDGKEDQDKNGVFNTWETNPNDSSDDECAMYVYELEPGNKVIFRVRNGTPNALMIPCYSLNGQGPTDVGIGIPMSLSPPISQLPAFRLGSGGYGEVTSARVPLSAPIGLPVYFQGVEILITPGQSIRLTNAILKPITENN